MEVNIRPGAVALWAVFFALAPAEMGLALFLAAAVHEWGHYAMLHRLGAGVDRLTVGLWGAEMEVVGRERLSYGGELLAVLAGPGVNLALAVALGVLGRWWERLYLFAGANAVLGMFNLLPVRPLDGGGALWFFIAWLTEPFTADRVTGAVELVVSLGLLALGGAILLRQGGSPFLLWAVLGILGQKTLVKWRKSR